jgi:hypothetical protein
MNPIRFKPSTQPTVQIKPSTVRVLSAAEVAAALGAVPKGEVMPTHIVLSPEPERIVPVDEKQRARLEELAAALAEDGFAPSIGQVANVLLGWELAQLGPDAIQRLVAELKAQPEA